MRFESRGLGRVGGWILGLAGGLAAIQVQAQLEDIRIDDVPDYEWHVGCFGTATGNLMGFWDRNGFPDFYTGPTGGGVAPLNSRSSQGNQGVFSLWASKAGRDGRPANQPGHEDDYYFAYESVFTDPYITAGRKEHAPDCIGDFIGLSQNKWADLGASAGVISTGSPMCIGARGRSPLGASGSGANHSGRFGYSFRVGVLDAISGR